MVEVGKTYKLSDPSWGKYVDNGKLRSTEDGELRHKNVVLLVKNCTGLPHTAGIYNDGRTNCIVWAVDKQVVVFTCERFLKPVTHIITIDDREITISDESYKDLKEQLK